MMSISFKVDGVPVPEGDLKRGRHGRLYWSNDKVLRGWKDAVSYSARAAMAGHPPLTGPTCVRAVFTMPRPKNHFRSGKYSTLLKDDAPRFVGVRPDLDKLDRAILDAMTGIVYTDDSRVAVKHTTKLWGPRSGVMIEVFQINV